MKNHFIQDDGEIMACKRETESLSLIGSLCNEIDFDIFEILRNFKSVKQVSNLYKTSVQEKINFLFFICPCMNNKGIKIAPNRLGFTTTYLNKLNTSTIIRISLVNMFISEMELTGISFDVTAIFSNADSLILFPLPVSVPREIPELDQKIKVVPNLDFVRKNMDEFANLYYSKPWKKIPEFILKNESDRLKEFLPKSDALLKNDFVNRTFAGFSLDGILIRQGYFGKNPIILGVEAPGVAKIQNSALEKKNWIPIVSLV